MNELALFAGAGGGILGGKLLGWKTICAVEINSYCARRLMQRQNEKHLPPFPIWDDVCTFDGRPWRGIVDVVSGGFPCQDISVIGRGAGIDGKRSGLWQQMFRIVCDIQPKFVFVENSPALTTRGLGHILGNLASIGFDAEWDVFGARHVGACHKRDRMFILGHANSVTGLQTNSKRDAVGKRRETWEKFECLYWKAVPQPNRAIPKRSLPRVDDGMAYWMEHTRPAGNGQVPAVAALAFMALIERISAKECLR